MAKAKTMSRSRNQLATAYAPESFFTFEGGLGACISRSTAGASVDLSEPTKELIYERMNELGSSWFDRAMSAREGGNSNEAVKPLQCVDRALLNSSCSEFQLPGEDRFHLCKPSHMGYTPAPLSFVCRTCGMFKDYKNLNELDKNLSKLTPEYCPNPRKKGQCDWEQLDVIFVHWSGNWAAPFPGQWQWDSKKEKVVPRRSRCTCNSADFRLNRKSPQIGEWFFECAVCDKPLHPGKWLQNDKDTLAIIGRFNYSAWVSHVRMEATPYRASNAYYLKSDLFVDFKDGSQDLLTRLRPSREEALKDFVAIQYGFAVDLITDEDVENACAGKDECNIDLAEYRSAVSTIRDIEELLENSDDQTSKILKKSLDTAYVTKKRIIDDLHRREILIAKVNLPSNVLANIHERQTRFASKFDPFRLAVEHSALKNTRLDVETKTNGKKKYVSFTRLDEDLAPNKIEETEEQQIYTRELLDKLGLDDMGLIREFDLCKFSFGYSRMESTPTLEKRGKRMPVRMRLFPKVKYNDISCHPVYVVQQSNEALYVRLKEETVVAWLKDLNCSDMFSLNPTEKIGAGILNVAQPMKPFLDQLEQSDSPSVYYYIYTLLHSYSHLLMKHVSEYSGLDLGSLGEYIFPADLAFVVYRSGTTMDLGNLSAMWRNSGTAMLSSLLSIKATQCGTGSLCTQRGGACPDCIMIPETSCIAGNKLLSRTVLRSIGGRPKRFDIRKGAIDGYFDSIM